MVIGCKYYNGNDPAGSKEKAYAKTGNLWKDLRKDMVVLTA
jgi:hypothetical protein